MDARPSYPECLHCRVCKTVDAFFEEHGRRNEAGTPIIDVEEVVARLCEVIGEAIHGLPTRAQRRVSTKFAHDSIDAALKAQREGRSQAVVIDAPTEH